MDRDTRTGLLREGIAPGCAQDAAKGAAAPPALGALLARALAAMRRR